MKQTFLVVDTEHGFVAKFRRRIDDEELGGTYEVVPLVPDVTLPSAAMVTQAVAALEELVSGGAPVTAVFIDIVLLEESDSGLIDTSGIALAKAMRARFPELPIYNVTSRHLREIEADALSEATLHDVDGVFIKTYLTGNAFSPKRLRAILERGRAKRRGADPAPSRHSKKTPVAERAHASLGGAYLDARVQRQVEELGNVAFWELIGQLMPDVQSGSISFMRPGRSGAYVFKVLAKHVVDGVSTNAKPWLVKLSRDAAALASEARAYRQLPFTRLPKSQYPQLVVAEPQYVGSLGGLLMELQEDGVPLTEYFASPDRTDKEAEELALRITSALTSLCGDVSRKVSFLWREHYELSHSVRQSALAFLQDHRALIVQRLTEASLRAISAFLVDVRAGAPDLYDTNSEISLALIHGDLNAGNVLVTSTGVPVFIDFAQFRQGHIATDLAKLERDAFFRLLGHGTPEYYGWLPKGLPEAMATATAPAPLVEPAAVHGHTAVVLRFARALRTHSSTFMHETMPSGHYHAALLHHATSAIANESLPVPRRVSGLEYLSVLLPMANSAARA